MNQLKKHPMRTYTTLLAAASMAAALALPVASASAGKPGLSASVNRLDCGTQAVGAGSKACGSVTFTNTSSGTVQVGSDGIDETGAVDFTMASSTCIAASYLAPGESCVIDVSFRPVTTGRRSAKLLLHENINQTTTYVRLIGVGI